MIEIAQRTKEFSLNIGKITKKKTNMPPIAIDGIIEDHNGFTGILKNNNQRSI